MKIGYDREKSEEYGKRFGLRILMTDEKLGELPVAGHRAIDGLIESAEAAGLSAEDDSAKEGYLLIPVEYPLVSTRVMRAVMAAVSSANDGGANCRIARATYEGKKGFPVYVQADLIEEFDINQITEETLLVPVDEEGCILESSSPEEYEDIRTFVAKGYAREKLELLTARKKIFLVCAGESDSFCMDILNAMGEDVEAEALGMDKFGKEPMPAIERIYSADETDSIECAESILEEVNRILPAPVAIKKVAGLREIADEDVYDMQYRTVGALRELLRFDDAKDIIIVTHSGVCRALEQNIKNLRVDDEWEPMEKGTFRMFEPFPEQPSEKVNNQDKPMTSDSLTMEAVLEYYE
ncbi:MAG: hypothetical protein MJ144_01650 [Clostridia bacterium]|nr:hypothetical protein [Clostridia bacterium]